MLTQRNARPGMSPDRVVKPPSEQDLALVKKIVTDDGLQLVPLFASAEDSAKGCPSDVSPQPAQFFRVAGDETALRAMAQRLRQNAKGVVRAAYLSPEFVLPQVASTSHVGAQAYLRAPTDGIGARFAPAGRRPAWEVPGGKGAGVQVLDIEGAWNFQHEDLLGHLGGLKGGTPIADQDWEDHGTAVAGIIAGDDNTLGVTGIAPEATFSAMSVFQDGEKQTVPTIYSAAWALGKGDVLLIEQQVRTEDGNLVPVEWVPDALTAITCATRRGIVVVEPAGNGGLDLDKFPPFQADLLNPLTTEAPSGAVMVGAGATLASEQRPQRSRLPFSNYGARLDAQAWGEWVATSGFGDISPETSDKNKKYTQIFNGTSSASAIVAGAIASLQGQRLAAGLGALTPQEVRQRLLTTGSPQQGPAERIGSLPDISGEGEHEK